MQRLTIVTSKNAYVIFLELLKAHKISSLVEKE